MNFYINLKKLKSIGLLFISIKAECYKKTNCKKRFHFAGALKRSGMTFVSARRLGFPISRKLWRNCTNEQARNKG